MCVQCGSVVAYDRLQWSLVRRPASTEVLWQDSVARSARSLTTAAEATRNSTGTDTVPHVTRAQRPTSALKPSPSTLPGCECTAARVHAAAPCALTGAAGARTHSRKCTPTVALSKDGLCAPNARTRMLCAPTVHTECKLSSPTRVGTGRGTENM